MQNNYLEIFTDASITKFNCVTDDKKLITRTFGCAGAICRNTLQEDYLISQDTTNNRSELLGVFLGLKLGNEIMRNNPGVYQGIILYSDSQFAIFGLTKWMDGWMKTIDSNGVIYNASGQYVKNQELFMCILSYISINKLNVRFMHCKGHVRYTSTKKLMDANKVFYESNGIYLRPEDIYKVAYYNDLVDRSTREKLQTINPSDYHVLDYSNNYKIMAKYVFPNDYKKYIGNI